MFQSIPLLEYPEEEPDSVVFTSLPAGPRARRRAGAAVQTQKAGPGLIIAVTGASLDASTGLTSASGVGVVALLISSRGVY